MTPTTPTWISCPVCHHVYWRALPTTRCEVCWAVPVMPGELPNGIALDHPAVLAAEIPN